MWRLSASPSGECVPSQSVIKSFIFLTRKLERKPNIYFSLSNVIHCFFSFVKNPIHPSPFSHGKVNLVSISKLKILLNKCLPYETLRCLWLFFFQQKLLLEKFNSASSRVKLEISKTLSDHWLLVGYSMCTVIVAVLINSGSDNCLSLVLFPRNHKQPNVLTTQLGMSRTGNKMLDFFKRISA